MIRFGGADLVISDQRRAFSDKYENLVLLECDCFAEISGNNHLSGKAYLLSPVGKHRNNAACCADY